jgi:hypothetical protein
MNPGQPFSSLDDFEGRDFSFDDTTKNAGRHDASGEPLFG